MSDKHRTPGTAGGVGVGVAWVITVAATVTLVYLLWV